MNIIGSKKGVIAIKKRFNALMKGKGRKPAKKEMDMTVTSDKRGRKRRKVARKSEREPVLGTG